jgi:anti-sigma factor RsiW
MEHPPEHVLQAYFDAELPDHEATRVRDHCRACAACRGVLAELEAVRYAMAQDAPTSRPEPVWPRIQARLDGHGARSFSPLFAAGTAAACLAGIVLGLLLGAPATGDLTEQDPVTQGTIDQIWPATTDASLLDIYTGALAQERSGG